MAESGAGREGGREGRGFCFDTSAAPDCHRRDRVLDRTRRDLHCTHLEFTIGSVGLGDRQLSGLEIRQHTQCDSIREDVEFLKQLCAALSYLVSPCVILVTLYKDGSNISVKLG